MKRSRDSPDAASTFDPVPEVFLSFRGPDTRHSFTDFLYYALVVAGVHVFKDDEELRVGEKIGGELLRAIECSKVYVPIFSRTYAASAWCLRELTYMVECASEGTDKVILPIFYDVKPDDVKLKVDVKHKSLYLDDLEKHMEKFGHDTVQQWKEALIDVGRIRGWDLQEKGHGEIIRAVVSEVLTKLTKGRIMPLPDHLLGIDGHMQNIMKLLQEGPRDISYLVIYGMGGIGKTVLAKAVFNEIFDQFDVYCFLSNVHESARAGKIMDLQKQLLSKLGLGRSLVPHSSVNDGIYHIIKSFRDKKVLLILDDVDTKDQLFSLARKKDWFGPKSKIIITTRDIDFLPIEEEDQGMSFQERSQKFEFYEMTDMDSSHALQLFSRHAFEMDFPPLDFADIAPMISSKAGGLPLDLEVLGSSLRGKTLYYWVNKLDMLYRRFEPCIFEALSERFEVLKPCQKEIFLDIACFFIGREKIPPYYMWKASNYFPKEELPVLARMSLIKIVENDTLWMTAQLRDFGREIIAREDDNNPGRRSRLWNPVIASYVIRLKELTPNVRALRLTGLSTEYNFTSEEFSNVPNLRLLELEGGNLVGDFKNLLSELTWFSWSNCPSDLKATNLCLQKLVVLELSGSNITEDWAGWGPCLVSKDLKVIQITQCTNLKRIPDISKCSKLKRLVLQGGETSLVVNGSLSKLVFHGF